MNEPEFSTKRLVMRRHRIQDFDTSLGLWSDPDVTQHIGGRPFTREEVWARLLRYIGHWNALGYGYWIVTERTTGRFVGEVGFADYQRDMQPSISGPEAGWVLATWAAGQGFATEAVTAALGWADETMRWRRLTCIIKPGHNASVRVAEKVGFDHYGQADYKDTPIDLYERVASS